jgi:serine/threonine protein kinase
MIHRIARYFGAAKKAISALDEYYHRGLPAIKKLDPAKRPNVSYPYPRQYQSLVDGTVHTFKYSAPVQQDKLIFRARDGNVDICVKFVRRYSKEAHLKCASMGFAPRLMGFEKVPRGWYMVVMEYLDDTYQDLDDSQFRAGFSDQLLANLVALHQAGYAHGDIRGPNIMVRKTGQGRALLVDFDWAGVINEVRYPMYLNEDLVRPEGAAPGELIAAEHDMKMLHIIFDPPKRSDV